MSNPHYRNAILHNWLFSHALTEVLLSDSEVVVAGCGICLSLCPFSMPLSHQSALWVSHKEDGCSKDWGVVEDPTRQWTMGEESLDSMGLDGYDTGASNKLSRESSSTKNFVTVECTCINLYAITS